MIDLESMLRLLSESDPEGQLRVFGCECCDRVSKLCAEPLFTELVEFGRSRSIEPIDAKKMKRLQEQSVALYESLYPGFGTPSGQALAFNAAGEVAFTASSLQAAINASTFAAEAVAANAAQAVGANDYDAVYESAYSSERVVQAVLLRKYGLT
jgi:hypothetical protein